jgi:hypothetical protein
VLTVRPVDSVNPVKKTPAAFRSEFFLRQDEQNQQNKKISGTSTEVPVADAASIRESPFRDPDTFRAGRTQSLR